MNKLPPPEHRSAAQRARRRTVLRMIGAGVLTTAGGVQAQGASSRGTKVSAKVSATGAGGSVWRPDRTVIVVLENLSAFEATPSQQRARNAPVYSPASDWPYLNALAQRGMRFTNAHFTRTPYNSELPTRPSQPNYLYLFSGHHQGVLPAWFEDSRSPYEGFALRDRNGQTLPERVLTQVGVANNNVPNDWLPLRSPNLGAAIVQSGGTFLSFSESLPYPSWNCGTDSRLVPCNATFAPTDDYRRKHNPAINWTDQNAPTSPRGLGGDLAENVLPVSVNLGFEPTLDPVLKRAFRGFSQDPDGKPLPFEQLPTVSIVVPNEQHDAHSNSAKVADDWLRRNLGAYADWAMQNNSLLIVTFDEDGSTDGSKGDPYVLGAHRIPTLFFGAGVRQGESAQRIDHLNVLATVLWQQGALERFRADFKRFYRVVEGSGSEAEREWQNLQPITDVFLVPGSGR